MSKPKFESPKIHTGGRISCIQNNKSLSWIYANKKLSTVILIDPLMVNLEYLSIIEESAAKEIFIILTSCEKKKKEYVHIWNKIYKLDFFVPHSTRHTGLVDKEKIYDKEEPQTIYCSNNTFPIAQLIGSHADEYHTLMLYLPPYLFSGALLQEKAPINNFLSTSTRNYIHSLPPETVVLPSLGPISSLFSYHNL